MMLEGDNLRDPQDHDNDPHILKLEPFDGKFKPQPVLNAGAPVKMEGGGIFTSMPVYVVNSRDTAEYLWCKIEKGVLWIVLANEGDL